MFNFNDILTTSLALFAVIDILGSIPVLISFQERSGAIHAARVTLISGAIMAMFLFLGEELLGIMGIDVNSFALAGAVVIFIIAMEMILERNFFRHKSGDSKGGQIVPIAFPLIAGAGTLSTLISLRSEFHHQDVMVAILFNLVVIFITLKLLKPISRWLGKGGIEILRRVFGIVLLAIAIKLFKSNVI